MCCTTLFFTAVFRSYMNQSCKLLRQIFNKVQNEKKLLTGARLLYVVQAESPVSLITTMLLLTKTTFCV